MKSLLIAFACILTTIVILLRLITHGADTAFKKEAVVVPVAPEVFTPFAKPPPSGAARRYRIRGAISSERNSGRMLPQTLHRQRFRSPTSSLLALPGYQISKWADTNKSGTVVGYSQETLKDGGTPTHAVFWVGRQIRDLGIGHAFSINGTGNIVGDSSTGQEFAAPLWTANPEYYDAFRNGPSSHALLWTRGYRYDLNDCIPLHSGWVLSTATDINDKGQITGQGLFHSKEKAFLLTPQTKR